MRKLKQLFSFFWDKSLLSFLLIGAGNTVVSMAISFVLQVAAGWGLFAASALSFAVASVPSFILNRKFSFRSKAPLGRSLLRFSTIVTVCFLLSYALNHLVVPWMHARWFPGLGAVWYTLLRIVGIQVVFTLLNYLGQRLWAFKD